MSKGTSPEQRAVLNDTLGDIAANMVYRALDGLADAKSSGEDSKPKDYDKAIDTAIKVLRFFEFSSMDAELDADTQAKVDELRQRLPNRVRRRTTRDEAK